MAKYGMVIDVSRCTACFCCFTACKDEYWDNDYLPYSAAQPRFGENWIQPVKKERGAYPFLKVSYTPQLCQHCEDAPCIKAAKNNAIYKRNDGVVLIDPEKSKGQKQLVGACPYHAIFWNEEKNIAQKCTFCAHRLAEGKIPRCAQICPGGAIKFGDLDDPKSEVSQLMATGKADLLRPEIKTRTQVMYLNLPKLFIAGCVVLSESDECAVGASVTLAVEGSHKLTKTNDFGEFVFDGLTKGSYSIKIEYAGYGVHSKNVNLGDNIYYDAINLSRS